MLRGLWLTAWITVSGLTAVMTACSRTGPELRAAANALSRAADECLLDVRDRHLTWETSGNCKSLSPLASSYIAAGGFNNEADDIRLIAEEARTTAWMARATSLAGGLPLSIW
jgi:hypothetical protein